jgi:16S rRNA (guanine1516-N2)-methyltransferase
VRSDLSQKIAVVATPDSDLERARQFAESHGLTFSLEQDAQAIASSPHPAPSPPPPEPRPLSPPYILFYQAHSVSIVHTQKGAPGPVSACFVSGKAEHRRKFGGGRGQLIAKAVGLKNGIIPSVLDATAGLGRDAFVLASLGCKVQLLERSPVISELLSCALQVAQSSEIADIIARMTLETADAVQWLNAQVGKIADVIYLDPMYPQREKSSLVKKEMRVFKELVGTDMDDSALLAAALDKARYRIVVKRPRKGVVIEGPAPTYQLNGKSSRYDIYALKGLDNLKVR